MTQSQLIDILSISHRWIIPLGVEYAVDKLATMSLSPAFQFHLLRRYDIEQWIPRVTRSLLFTDLSEMTGPDAAFLGISVFFALQRGREKMIFHRQKIGRRVPYPDNLGNAPFCAQHATCHKAWHEEWISHVQSRVLGPPGAFPLSTCADYVNSLSHSHMETACKDYLVLWLRTLPTMLREEEFVSRVVLEMQDLLR